MFHNRVNSSLAKIANKPRKNNIAAQKGGYVILKEVITYYLLIAKQFVMH
jgi:hypothetical protein